MGAAWATQYCINSMMPLRVTKCSPLGLTRTPARAKAGVMLKWHKAAARVQALMPGKGITSSSALGLGREEEASDLVRAS